MDAREALAAVKYAGFNLEEPYHTQVEQVVVAALEKQIPKKQRTDNHDWRCCPRCYKTFSMVNVLNERNSHCGNCGQALDWEGQA